MRSQAIPVVTTTEVRYDRAKIEEVLQPTGVSATLTAGVPRTLFRRVNPKSAEERAKWRERERLKEMERRGEIKLGPGKVPSSFWDMPVPEDPEGLVKQALIEDRNKDL